MQTVLKVMGFGPGFCRWVTLLYGATKTAIRLGSLVSDFFQIGRGTRQGCPLSPFLFTLMMEPMARALRLSDSVGAIHVGTIKECIALYADDMLLFLRDWGLSLRAALLILDKFAAFSGLRANWSKSSILPLGREAKKLLDHTLQLQWVSSITYLGVKITANVQDYMSLNLLPLVNRLKQKVSAWKNLPLSLLGRVSLPKMKFLSVILFFLRHSPLWIPKSFFKSIDGIIGSFLWSPQSPRISIKILKEPWGQGGLALPDCQKYYLAGQMVFARRWLIADSGDSATVFEAALLGSYESLKLALYRGPKSCLPLTDSMKSTIKAWEITTTLRSPSYSGITPSAPPWMNPKFLHLFSFPDPMIWACKGVKILNDITREGELCTFDQLKAWHNLPNSFFFRYLQLRHAFQEQFKNQRIEYLSSELENLLTDEELAKPLSSVYRSLFNKTPAGIVFWKCSQVQIFWLGIKECLAEVLSLPVPLTPRVCLIGLVEEVVPSRAL